MGVHLPLVAERRAWFRSMSEDFLVRLVEPAHVEDAVSAGGALGVDRQLGVLVGAQCPWSRRLLLAQVGSLGGREKTHGPVPALQGWWAEAGGGGGGRNRLQPLGIFDVHTRHPGMRDVPTASATAIGWSVHCKKILYHYTKSIVKIIYKAVL